MNSSYPYLKDTSFLKKIDTMTIKEQFVKITVLDWKEQPIEEIQGLVQSGSVNIDGSSSVRRTANLTMITKDESLDVTKVKSLISINKKIKLSIGLTNNIKHEGYSEYDIIWFPLGVYVVISPSISNTTSGVSISLQLKDKMCLLNGDCGGILPASVYFHEYETANENGEIVIQQPTIEQIIRELVNHWGKEQLGKIIISDIPDRIKQVMKWIGNTPLYIGTGGEQIDYSTNKADADDWEKEGREVLTYEYGYDIGYVYTDFTYPGELIGDAGNSVCTILDTIKNTLGNYEYFYDIDGNFVFQEIKNYLNTTLTKEKLERIKKMDLDNNDYLLDLSKGKSVYNFEDGTLISSYSNAPQYNMINNDFIVWGIRKTPTGLELPIRYHLAIDDKPVFTSNQSYPHCFRYQDPNDGLYKIKRANSYAEFKDLPLYGYAEVFYYVESERKIYTWGVQPLYHYIDNSTGIDYDIEEYFNIDSFPSVGLLNVLYYAKNQKTYYIWNATSKNYIEYEDSAKVEPAVKSDTQYPRYYPINDSAFTDKVTTITVKGDDWRTHLYMQGAAVSKTGTDSNDYFAELDAEWPKIFNFKEKEGQKIIDKPEKIVPEDLDWYLDIIDSDSAIAEFSIKNIGKRSKVVTDNTINCIFEPDIPDIVIINSDADGVVEKREECEKQEQPYVQVSDIIFSSIATGGSFNSAYNLVRDLLYQYTSYNESVNITAIPIYYLEPNVRITINDTSSNIFGDYMIKSISLPLDLTSTMSISAVRALERF